MNNKIAFIGYNNFSSDIFNYDIDDDILTQVTGDIFSLTVVRSVSRC